MRPSLSPHRIRQQAPSETLICPFAFPISLNPTLKHRASCVALAEKDNKNRSHAPRGTEPQAWANTNDNDNSNNQIHK